MADARSLARMFDWRVKRSQNLPALRYRVTGAFRDLTYGEWQARARRAARGLIGLGVQAGDRVALLTQPSAPWAVIEIGTLLAGAVCVPLYPSSHVDVLLNTIASSGARVLVVDRPEQLRRIWDERHRIPAVEHIIVLHREGPSSSGAETDGPAQPHLWLDELLDAWSATDGDEQLAQEDLLTPESPAAQVMTVGTTEPQEPISLTHGQLAAQAEALADGLAITDGDVLMLGQPPAWAFTRALLLAAIRAGAVIALAADEDTALEDARDVQPTLFAATTPLCERLYRGVVADLPDRSVAGQRVLAWARSLGTEVSRMRESGQAPDRFLSFQRSVASRLAFGPLRSTFGGNLRLVVGAGGRMPRSVAELFDAADLRLVWAYTLTAASGVAHVGSPGGCPPGSVGRALPGIETRIDENGEILLRGAPVAGAGEDGWLATGDLGRLDDEGLLWLIGRRSQRIVLEDGHTVDPAALESLLRQHPFIEHAAVCGHGRKYVGALVALDRRTVTRWAERRSIALGFEELCSHPDVYRIVQEHVQEKNSELADFETIKKLALVDGSPSEETGDLTPIGLLRRATFLDRYRWIVDSFYSEAY